MSLRCLVFIAIASAPNLLSAASPDDLDARLRAMEQRWQAIESELAALRAEVAKTSATPAAAPLDARIAQVESAVNTVRGEVGEIDRHVSEQRQLLDARAEADARAPTLSSYGTLDLRDYSNRTSAFDAVSYELLVSGQPSDRVSFFSELEFERAASVGGSRGGEVLVEQAYVDLGILDHLSLRGGVLLMPFGNKNVDHFAAVREVVSQPLSAYMLAPSDWADNGLGVVGDRAIGDDWRIDYSAYLTTGLGAGIGEYGFRSGAQPFGVDNNDDKSMVGRLAFTRNDGTVFGISGYSGKWDNANRLALTGFGIDGILKLGQWRWTGEWLNMSLQRSDRTRARSSGGYLRTIYTIDPAALPENVSSRLGDATLSLVHEYDYVSLASSLQGSDPERREWRNILGLLLSLDHHWIFKLNREYSDFAGAAVVNGHSDAWLLSIGYVF